jgi:hypothetical protein
MPVSARRSDRIMTTSPTPAESISALTGRLDRIERVLGLAPLVAVLHGDGAAPITRESLRKFDDFLQKAVEHELDDRARLRNEGQSASARRDADPRVASDEAVHELDRDLVALDRITDGSVHDDLSHGSPHSSVTGTPEGSDSAGSPSGDPVESCGDGLAFRVLLAAHLAADELDDWYGGASTRLGGVSPGGVVRHWANGAYGASIDSCPACRALAAVGL